jgi:hypothetical protein
VHGGVGWRRTAPEEVSQWEMNCIKSINDRNRVRKDRESHLGVSIAETMSENERLFLLVSLSPVKEREGKGSTSEITPDNESLGRCSWDELIVGEDVVGTIGPPRAKCMGTGPVAESKSKDVRP